MHGIFVVSLAMLFLAQGPPFHYWGARPPVIKAPPAGDEAVDEVHTAQAPDGVILRFTWNRPVEDLLVASDGRPVSGRLRATLYWDLDGIRLTGLDAGRDDLRSGAERRLDVGVVAIGEDPDEGREARSLLTAALYDLSREGSQSLLWRTDSDARPLTMSRRGSWLELRLPTEILDPSEETRMVLVQGGVATSGRFEP